MVRNEILDDIYAARETLLKQHAGSLHDYVVAARTRALESHPADLSPYGRQLGSGAAAIDIVVKEYPLRSEFSVEQIEAEVRRRGLPEREAVREHLYKLESEGHVSRINGNWTRLN